jgi:hypothetical protein
MSDEDGPHITELRPLSEAESRPASRIVHRTLYSSDGGKYVAAYRQDLSPVVLIEFTGHPSDNGPDRRVLKETLVAGGLPEGKKPGSLSDYRLARSKHRRLRRDLLAAKAKRDIANIKTETATAVKKG